MTGGNGTVACNPLHHDVEKSMLLPLATSSPYGDMYTISGRHGYLFPVTRAQSLRLGGSPGLPVCSSPNGSSQQTSFSCTCTDSGKPAMTPPGEARNSSDQVAHAKPAMALSLLLAVTMQQTAPSHSSQLGSYIRWRPPTSSSIHFHSHSSITPPILNTNISTPHNLSLTSIINSAQHG